MPSIWFTGISHSLKSEPSMSSARSASSMSWLIFSDSVNPLVSIPPIFIRKFCSCSSQSFTARTE